MRIVVIGTGYVGLVTGACFAEMGHTVVCVDINEEKIAGLNEGVIPIYEPGLEELVRRNRARLSFTTSYQRAVPGADICCICVPTPSRPDGRADLTFVRQAAQSIGAVMDRYTVVVNKSTVPVGTASRVARWVLEGMVRQVPFDVVSNPEFLKEGSAVADCMKPERILIGADSERARKIVAEAYAPFTMSRDRIVQMDVRSAEMTKYAANAMLATRISFMNELSGLCEAMGANINEVRRGIGSDSRIGHQFLYAGAGFGGSCFPKDLRALRSMGEEVGAPTPLLNAVENVNTRQKKVLGKKIASHFAESGGLMGKTIAVWGVAFKPDTDDIREAPALDLIAQLVAQGAHVRLYDPVALEKARAALSEASGIAFCRDPYEAAMGADAIALVTEWKEFRSIDFAKLRECVHEPLLFDGRNQYSPQTMQEKGFVYCGIGLPRKETRAACPV